MATQDLKNLLVLDQSIAPKAHTADATGASSDLAGFQSATVLIDLGLWTDGTHTFEVQDSPDDSTFAAVADADLIGTEPVMDAAAEDNTTHTIGYVGTKRFIRVKATVASATTGAVYGVSVLKGHPHLSTAVAR